MQTPKVSTEDITMTEDNSFRSSLRFDWVELTDSFGDLCITNV